MQMLFEMLLRTGSTRGCCMEWNLLFEWVYIMANLATGVSYFAIRWILRMPGAESATHLARLTPEQSLHARQVYGSFIMACGLMHIVENVVAFWWAPYHLFTIGHVGVAFWSVMAVVYTARYRARILVGI